MDSRWKFKLSESLKMSIKFTMQASVSITVIAQEIDYVITGRVLTESNSVHLYCIQGGA